MFMVQSYNFLTYYTILVLALWTLKKKQWCKAVGFSIAALSAVVFIYMVQSYNSVFQILLTLKKKQWCKAVGSSITSLSTIDFISLKECYLLKPCLPVAPCFFCQFIKLLLFWHRYFILLIFADIVYCCFRLHIY